MSNIYKETVFHNNKHGSNMGRYMTCYCTWKLDHYPSGYNMIDFCIGIVTKARPNT